MARFKKKYKAKKIDFLSFYSFIIVACVLFLTIGFSAFQASLDISDISAVIRVRKDIRITGITLSNSTNEAISHYEEYNVNSIDSSISLPNSNSTVTYDIEITNIGNVEMGILDITGLPSNLTYSISNYNLKNILCDDTNTTKCKLGTVSTLHLTIGYANNGFSENNIIYPLDLNFNFKRAFSIQYNGITNNNYPTTILESDTLEITFVSDIPSNITATGLTSYSYQSPKLTISNPIDDVVISGALVNRHYNQLVFDGTNYINTGIYLFSAENINKNFEISFDIVSRDTTDNLATIVSCMDESGSPWPGIVYRVQSETLDEFSANTTTLLGVENRYNKSNINKVTIKKLDGFLYINFNDGQDEQLLDMSTFTQPINVPLTIGATLDRNGNPWRYFKGTISNIDIKITEPETYTIKFDANGGTGTMPDQNLRKNESSALSANLYERTNFIFYEWNTASDGSGTSYQDQQLVSNLAELNNSITLYAMWTQGITYYVRYNSNGGTGTMNNQLMLYGTDTNLNTNTFTKANRTFVKWNTASDGSGTDYENGQSVRDLTKTQNGIIDLYAIWAEQYYSNANNYVFNGNNYINTGVYLFNQANINKNFEVSFQIVARNTTTNQATIMSCMDETGSPWPGMVYRIQNENSDQFGANVTTALKFERDYARNNVNKVTIKRRNHILYINFNDGQDEQILNMTSLTTTFNVPVTFGSSLNGNGNPQRYFTGTLSNMKAIVYE